MRVKCTYCNFNNHVREECRSLQRHQGEAQVQRDQENKGSVAHLAINQQGEKKTPSKKAFDLEHAFAAFDLSQLNLNDWYADSASTEHMTEHREYFTSFKPVSHQWNVKGVGKDNQPLVVKGKGDIKTQVTIGADVHYGILQDVLYVPGIGVNLFSIGKATDCGITAVFEKQSVKMYRGNNLELIGTRADKDLYQLNFKALSPEGSHSKTASSTVPGTISVAFPAISLDIWHRRFGHAHHAVIKKMEAENAVIGLCLSKDPVDPKPCKGCALRKSHRQPFPNSGRRRATKIGEIVHSDLCGPMSVPSITGSLYYVLFQDDASDFRVVYFQKTKCEAFNHYKIYAARMLTGTKHCISILRSVNGGGVCR